MRGVWTRRLGLFLIVAGTATLAWSLTVWQWRDPFSSLYTSFHQRDLEDRYDELANSATWNGDGPVRDLARAYRDEGRRGTRSGGFAFRV